MSNVQLIDLTLGYDRHPAVHHVNGTFEGGSLTAITGPNGGGKSTLIKAMAGQITPQSGRVAFEGITPGDIAYLPQLSTVQDDFPITTLQMIATGCWNRVGVWGAISSDLRHQAMQALETVGLKDFASRPVSSLSVGQFQRAMFARLLLQNAKLILLDEPFAAVDAETSVRLLELIKTWHKEGRTVICVLHDFSQIRAHFPECVLLARDCIAWGKTETVLTPEHINKVRVFREAWQPEAEVCLQ